MRVRVRFRYRADTGEVEVFRVEDTGDGTPAVDHDARHDRATADLARIIENNALIEQEAPELAIDVHRSPSPGLLPHDSDREGTAGSRGHTRIQHGA
jgi:hypothetical protein